MYGLIQTALTATIEAIALIAVVGLPAHYIVMSHVREVQSWGTPQATPAVKEAPKVATTRKTRSKNVPQVKLQPMSVGAAVVEYSEMTSEQLRKEYALQGVNWRASGDYGKPMKKAQMLAALR